MQLANLKSQGEIILVLIPTIAAVIDFIDGDLLYNLKDAIVDATPSRLHYVVI